MQQYVYAVSTQLIEWIPSIGSSTTDLTVHISSLLLANKSAIAVRLWLVNSYDLLSSPDPFTFYTGKI